MSRSPFLVGLALSLLAAAALASCERSGPLGEAKQKLEARSREMQREAERAAERARQSLEEARRQAQKTGKEVAADARDAASDAARKSREVKDAVERSTVGAKEKTEAEAKKAGN